ncbi:MAG: phosphatidylglycerophosphatase A [Deltaproteobacteria bacterium]|nr:phosphatidylglycerophosphatase A [Deltaproteobacteria bacterium]
MYAGYSPFAPGTVGTLLGVIIYYLLSSAGTTAYCITLSSGLLIAIWTSSVAQKHFGKEDPAQVVCDEVIGYLVAAFLVPFTVPNAIMIFLLFRFFDIAKPFPIGLIDRKIKGGIGIALDDIAAGIYSNIAFRLLIQFQM